jgi:hypothetical protein
MNLRWLAACAGAEAIGMAASAGAAHTSDGLPAALGFAVLVAGGLVEGTALGVAQSTVLATRLGPARRRAWVVVTVLVAGVGWAAGAAPATLTENGSDGPAPALGLIILGAAALGLVMGALLGIGQGAVLRRRVRHPWRWVPANALAWAVAMAVIFAGATTAGASWPWPAVVGYGALTGGLAGAGLGAVTGLWLDVLDGPPLRHRLVLRHLVARHAPAGNGLTALEVTGAHSGRTFRFPVMCAPLGRSSLVVLPGHPSRKIWWRQLGDEPMVSFLDAGAWKPARARVIDQGTLEWSVARAAYVARWRHARIEQDPLVVVDQHPEVAAREVPREGDQGPVEPGPDAVGAAAVSS